MKQPRDEGQPCPLYFVWHFGWIQDIALPLWTPGRSHKLELMEKGSCDHSLGVGDVLCVDNTQPRGLKVILFISDANNWAGSHYWRYYGKISTCLLSTCGWSPSVFTSCTFGRLWGCVANDFNTLKDSQAQVVFLALFPCDVVTGKEGKLWETNGCLCEVGFWSFLDRVYRVSLMHSWQGGEPMLRWIERIPIVREPCCSVLLCGFKWFLKEIHLLGK